MRSLAKKWEGDVTVVVENDLSDHRKDQGWERPDYSPAPLIIEPSRSERKEHLQTTDSPDDVHFFTGFHAYPETYWTLKQAANTDAEIGVLLEAGRPNDGMKAYLRKLRYSIHGLRWRKHLDYVLTMGALGEQWYRSCSFPNEKIRPYGYFVEPDLDGGSSNDLVSSNEFTVSFVGKIIKRKGVDVLVESLSNIQKYDWQLVVIGEGPIEAEVNQIATDQGISDRIRWLGTLDDYSDVRSVMAESDLLVLPSRYDGWGAVVNEALHEGTPVITTEMCGAADLIQHEALGTVVPPADTEALANALESRIKTGPVSKTRRKQIENWAEKSISPDVATDYVIDILQSQGSPVPPWRRDQKNIL